MDNVYVSLSRPIATPTKAATIFIAMVVLFFGLFSFVAQAKAATYYVDAENGNDSNAGTSEGSAWETISKVNGSSFSPGDNIYFKTGQEWREQLTVPSSGSSGNSITFGSYGTSSNPTINGSNLISSWEDYPNLTASLEAFWELDETSGSRVDEHGANDLTDNNTVTYDPGILNNAGEFEASNQEYLSITDNTSLSLSSDTSFTLAAWVKVPTPRGKAAAIVSKRPGSETGVEYSLMLNDQNPPVPYFEVANGIAKGTISNSSDQISTSTWNFIVAWHDASANTINVQLNNGTVRSAAWTGGTQNGSNPLYIGHKCSTCTGSFEKFFDGLIDEVGFWKGRVLTADERSVLYNSGSARAYPFTITNNVWEATLTTEPNQVFFNGTRGTQATSTASVDASNEWYWAENVLYVYSATDPDSAYSSPGIEASVRDRAIYANNKDYIVIDGIDVTKAKGEANIVFIGGADNSTVKDLTSSYAYDNGIIFTNDNMTIQNVRATNNGRGFGADPHGHGIYAGNSGGYTATNWLVEDSEFDNNARAGFHAHISDGGIIRRNIAHDNGEWGIITSTITAGPDIDIEYNLAYGNGIAGIEVSYTGNGTLVEIYNNVLYGNDGNGIYLHHNDSNSNNSILVKNNTFVENVEEDFYVSGTTGEYIATNDLFYRSDGDVTMKVNSTTFTLSELQSYLSASGNPDNHIADDPDFDDAPSADFHLLSTSPAIDAGLDVGLTEDFDGTAVPQGSDPDIGAFEYF